MILLEENVELKRRLATADQRLREREARYRLLIKGWAQAEWETDAEGVVAADSPSRRAYTGQTVEEWLGLGWLEAVHSDDRTHAERRSRLASPSTPSPPSLRLAAAGGGKMFAPRRC